MFKLTQQADWAGWKQGYTVRVKKGRVLGIQRLAAGVGRLGKPHFFRAMCSSSDVKAKKMKRKYVLLSAVEASLPQQ